MRRHTLWPLLLALPLFLLSSTAQAAHPECLGTEDLEDRIECAIVKGLEFAATQQHATGYLYDGRTLVAGTGLYCVKLIDRAHDLAVDPFDETQYEYATNLTTAVAYLGEALAHGDPLDPDGWELKVDRGYYTTYSTGIAAMCFASAAEADPDGTTETLDGAMTYGAITEGLTAWLVGNQKDSGCDQGGWSYEEKEYRPPWSDNSISGYATMGLGFAQSLIDYTIPGPVLERLDGFATRIQQGGGPYDGGSHYGGNWSGTYPDGCSFTHNGWINTLKTGNLLYELCLVEDPETSTRVPRALSFIETYWDQTGGDGNGRGWVSDYQAMFTMMKGLEGCGIETLDLGEAGEDWFALVAAWIVDHQQPDGGFYPGGRGNANIQTVWALLTLEKAVPRLEFGIPGQCVPYGADFEPFDADEYVVLGVPPYTWSYTGNTDLIVDKDESLFAISYPDGWTGSETIIFTATDANGKTSDDSATFTVSPAPIVGDIPDQVAPFETFDLDDFLEAPVPDFVTWGHEGNSCLGVSIDVDNVVTVTANDCQDPEIVTFTATAFACDEEVSGSDTATFTPNQPPDCSAAEPSTGIIWPPNHKFVGINVLGVTDPDGDAVAVTIDGIYQDEPLETNGDGTSIPDGQGVGTDTAEVRAERSGTKKVPGDGRVYHILFTGDDGRGGACSGEVLVGVPHDVKDVPVDGGALYDSTAVAP